MERALPLPDLIQAGKENKMQRMFQNAYIVAQRLGKLWAQALTPESLQQLLEEHRDSITDGIAAVEAYTREYAEKRGLPVPEDRNQLCPYYDEEEDALIIMHELDYNTIQVVFTLYVDSSILMQYKRDHHTISIISADDIYITAEGVPLYHIEDAIDLWNNTVPQEYSA